MAKDMRTYRGQGRRRYSGKTTFIICLLIALAVGLCIAAAVFFIPHDAQNGAFTLPGTDEAAVAGNLSGGGVGDLLPQGEFTYRINQSVVVSKGVANLRIENPAENRNAMQVTVTLEDGTVVYESGLIKPYHYIESDKLVKTPKAGSYKASAVFTVLGAQGETVGTASQELSLTVQ